MGCLSMGVESYAGAKSISTTVYHYDDRLNNYCSSCKNIGPHLSPAEE